MLNKDERLGTEKISKLFVRLAIPAVLAQIINLLYNIVDRIYIGHIENVGSEALTGVGVCLPLIMFISAFSSLCGMGGAPKAAIKMGEKKIDDANKILGNCFTLALILSVILTLVFSFFGTDLLLVFGASENTIPYASKYMSVYCLGTIFVMITMGLSSFITTQGHSKISMIYTITGALLNIALDPIFIFSLNLGVAGAALATIISQAVTAVLIIRFLLSKKSTLKISLKGMKLESKVILPCVALGLAPFIMMSTESVLSICFNTSLLKYGGDIAVGSMTILTSLMSFAMMPLQGFTQGAQPIISYNYGAKNPDRCKKAFKILLTTCIVYSCIFWLVIMVFPSFFASVFTEKVELIEFTTWSLRIYMFMIFLFGIQIACQQTFISLGNAPISLFLALLRKVILLIPLIYIVPLFTENKCLGVFLAEPIADFIAVTTTLILFVTTFNKTMKKIEPKENL
jgi:putative MATE family efflux protein